MSEDTVKEALHMIPYGFYAITTNDGEGDINIMVANWFSQVSFSPRLVALGLAKKSVSNGIAKKGKVFAVNLFRKEDDRIIKHFTKSRELRPNKVEDATFTLSPVVSCPVIDGAAAVLEVEIREFVDIGGDHDIVVGEVVNAQVFKPGDCDATLTLPHLGWSYAG